LGEENISALQLKVSNAEKRTFPLGIDKAGFYSFIPQAFILFSDICFLFLDFLPFQAPGHLKPSSRTTGQIMLNKIPLRASQFS